MTAINISCLTVNQRAGEELKELVGNEIVTFYVSPYLRSRLTYKYIRRAFLDEQVTCCSYSCLCSVLPVQVMFYREDPRLREQEWGNFQVAFLLCINSWTVRNLIVDRVKAWWVSQIT